MINPLECQACSCGTGPGYMGNITTFRGYSICGACATAWQILDKKVRAVVGRGATWDEFLHYHGCPACEIMTPKGLTSYMSGK